MAQQLCAVESSTVSLGDVRQGSPEAGSLPLKFTLIPPGQYINRMGY